MNFAFQLYYYHVLYTSHKNHYNIEFYTEILESVQDRLNNSGENDNETILAINKLLEEEKNKDRISKHLYMHVKGKIIIFSKFNFVSLCNSLEALIQTAVENISKMTRTETGTADKP